VREIEAPVDGAGLRVCVIAARWNSFITSRLLDGALAALKQASVGEPDVMVAWVPGSFEIPTAAKWAAESGRFDAVVCLGAVIRGETAHFEYVAGAAATGIAQVALETGIPCIFGVLTVDTSEQALERVGGKEGHKGEEAARAAIEMARLRQALAPD
jgi:6,7-dimethyl-8-ribityllumazine synthase